MMSWSDEVCFHMIKRGYVKYEICPGKKTTTALNCVNRKLVGRQTQIRRCLITCDHTHDIVLRDVASSNSNT